MRLPSGDHWNDCTPDFESVSFSASPPNGEIKKICGFSSRAEMNARRLQSGDQRGWLSFFLLVVSRIGSPPAVETSQTSASLAFSFISTDVTTYATHLPSGDTCASETFLIARISSGVIARFCCASVVIRRTESESDNRAVKRFIMISLLAEESELCQPLCPTFFLENGD